MKIVEVAEELKASVSLAKEFKETFMDLVKRDHCTEEELFEKIGLDGVLSNADLTRSQKINTIRWRMHKLRFPKLAETEEKFNQAKKRLKLPESIHINPSEFFEKKEIKIEIKSRSKEELKEQIEKLSDSIQQNNIDDLFV